MKKLLIISPHFPPVNSPDHQRVRMSLPYYAEFGWEPTVLCADPVPSERGGDELLLKSLPGGLRVVSVAPWSEKACRRFGFGHVGMRYPVPLHRAGTRLLKKEKFDLAFFSTTVFNCMPSGRRWRERFGLRYVLDIQDPWYPGDADYYDRKTAPGGMLKYRVSQGLSRVLERYTFRKVTHTISVSGGYVESLVRRYPWLKPEDFTVLPFGAPERDFEVLPGLPVMQNFFKREAGRHNWVYVGRGGPDLIPVLRILFRALAAARRENPAAWSGVRLFFIGTNYSPAHRTFKVVEPVAIEEGVGDLVVEHSPRVPYFEALKIMADSDGLILPGSNLAEYTASKLLPCLLAQRPLLAIFDERSLVANLLRQCSGVRLAGFPDADRLDALLPEVRAGLEWLRSIPSGSPHRVDWSALSDYTARNLTRRQCEVFDRCVGVRG